jgi:Peptidase inhibitor I78 family
LLLHETCGKLCRIAICDTTQSVLCELQKDEAMSRLPYVMAMLVLLVAACQTEPGVSKDKTHATCGAADLQGLVGQDRSVLATMKFAVTTRIIEKGMAITMDYSESRLNILIGEDGTITRVSCG